MDMNIEMDKNTATDSITSRLADARNDLGITQKDLAIISSIDTPKTAAGLSTLFQTNFFRLFFRYCTGV